MNSVLPDSWRPHSCTPAFKKEKRAAWFNRIRNRERSTAYFSSPTTGNDLNGKGKLAFLHPLGVPFNCHVWAYIHVSASRLTSKNSAKTLPIQ